MEHNGLQVSPKIEAEQRAARTLPTTDDTGSVLVHKNVVAVALANKNARVVWALLAHEREYNADYQ